LRIKEQETRPKIHEHDDYDNDDDDDKQVCRLTVEIYTLALYVG
jgi:hypothetical protein